MTGPLPLVTSQWALTQRSCKLRCNSLCQVTCKLGCKEKFGGLRALGSPVLNHDPFFIGWRQLEALGCTHVFTNLLAGPGQEMESDVRRFTVHWHKAQTNACAASSWCGRMIISKVVKFSGRGVFFWSSHLHVKFFTHPLTSKCACSTRWLKLWSWNVWNILTHSANPEVLAALNEARCWFKKLYWLKLAKKALA